MPRPSTDRRSLLKGVTLGAGGLLLSPLLGRLRAHADGAAPPPKRFVFVTVSNGLNPRFVQPAGLERGRDADGVVEVPLARHDLPFVLQPLTPFKDRVTVVQGLSGKVCGGGHSTGLGALGVYPGVKKGAMAETIDLALARARPSLFRHVGLEVASHEGTVVTYERSASGPGQPVPMLCRPDLAYDHLFGSVAGDAARQAFDARGSLLDFVVDDVKRVEARLAGEERDRFRSYLNAYEAMRDRRSRLNDVEATLRKQAPVVTDKYRSADNIDRLDAHFDLAAAALVGGLTDVVTISTQWNQRYAGLGITLASHPIGHGKGENGKTAAELAQIVRRFYAELIARLAGKLDAVKEGDGTMLDNTAILFLSDAAESHHSQCAEWPMVLVAGRLGGKLKAGGRYLDYPRYGRPGHRTIASLYAALLHAAGAPRDSFGVADPNLNPADQKGPLGELLA